MERHPLIGIVIQARMGSTRLPGKVLMPIGDRPLLAHILERLSALAHPVQIVVATSSAAWDDAIAVFGKRCDVQIFRGSEDDVLDRYYQCAVSFCFAHIVRLTGDNPFVDVEELDRLIHWHLQCGADYTSSIGRLPEGVGAEIFSFTALQICHLYGRKPHHREHVNEFVLEHPNRFRTAVLTTPDEKNRPDIRLTVDTPADYRRACRLVDTIAPGRIKTVAAIAALDRHDMVGPAAAGREAEPV